MFILSLSLSLLLSQETIIYLGSIAAKVKISI